MKAIVYHSPGDPSVLQYEDRPIPEIGKNEVLIKVAAAGVNRPDVFQRKGNYPAPKGAVQDILGLEVSGEIVETDSEVEHFKVGDYVMALVPGGGYAEYVNVDAGSCLPIPKGFSVEDAASLPEVLFTVWHNVFQRGKLQANEDVLIYGGSGGIGSMAIQLVTLAGSNAHTLVSSAEKEDYCRSLGAVKVVNYITRNLQDSFGKDAFNLILDSVGGDFLDTNLNLLKTEGRLVYINAMEGGKPALNIFKVMQKRLHITGSTLRARSNDFKHMLATDILKNAFPLIENSKFKNMVTHRFPLSEAAEAHRLMDSRNFMGKILLIV